MNRRQLLVGAAALIVLPTAASELRYRVPITLIEDTCLVPYSWDDYDWRRDTVIISARSLSKMFDVLRRCAERRDHYVDWPQVLASISYA